MGPEAGADGEMMRRTITVAMFCLLATPAVAEFSVPCLWKPFGGCSVTFVSPEYAAKKVEPLNPQAALEAVNAFRAENGVGPVELDARLTRAAAMQSKAQAERSWIGHYGAGGTTAKDRARAAGYPAKIASENVAAGQKSFGDVMHFWKQSSGHRTNLLRPNVSAIGVAMAQTSSGRAYWTLVLGGQ
ncbi:MAG: CAP domain-containing protein [Hyphomicrobiales bacterium]